ncbi:hypothetical protein ABT224_25280 [Streptomyces sp. NPDC001584]|uniref:virginiamycin B lyase family protein n=1 Tax=Streptomyces sp. NPDC001584 TaxID=3154521 RepID=UPI00331FF320
MFGGNRIGRITPSGVITQYDVPSNGLAPQPQDIVAGPDDSLWFTDRNSGQIGRISTSGVIAMFPLPSSERGPWGITKGPDDDIWFAETASFIGHLHLTDADLAVAKSDTGSDPVVEGQNVTYTLTATNNGPETAEGVVLQDTLPAGLQFVSASPGCTTAGTTPDVVTCGIGTLTAGASAARTVTATATTEDVAVDTAGVAGAVSDPAPANDTATETTAVDAVTCFGERPTITGTPGNDQINGTPARDVILARGGNDTINSGPGDDLVCGGPGADSITGGPGNDRVAGGAGGAGDDTLHGSPGNDTVTGGPGDDSLFGDMGNDDLDGGPGTNSNDGGPGTDVCANSGTGPGCP